MCRLLAVTAAAPFAPVDHLRPFAEMARTSREYQGHGWGCAWLEDGDVTWRTYRALVPVWEDDLRRFRRARVFMAHARSAFRDEGITVEHNMPFVEGPAAFVFNGELRGVRIVETGRIGAEKLFRFLIRHQATGEADRLRTAVSLVRSRARYVRAMNFIIGSPGRFLVSSFFNEDDEYFTMQARRSPAMTVVCSAAYEPADGGAAEPGWTPVGNGAIQEIPWLS